MNEKACQAPYDVPTTPRARGKKVLVTQAALMATLIVAGCVPQEAAVTSGGTAAAPSAPNAPAAAPLASASPSSQEAAPPASPPAPLPTARPAAKTVSDENPLHKQIDALASKVDAHVVANRRYIHQHPELSSREFETAKYIAQKLRDLGLEVQTPVAKTGIVAVLRGAKPGPVVALRSELDALPVTEEVDLPFKSTVRSTFDGQPVGVAHVCGHDAHMAILLGVAEIFAQMKAELPGTVKFLFQPAEEGAPPGEKGGAELMIEEGALSKDPKPEVIFGVHASPLFETGELGYRSKGILASDDVFTIVVHGRQTHAGMPWTGLDPIVVSAQILLALQTIPSRQMDLLTAPVMLTVGKISGGVRNNIIPDEVTMKGTLRAFDPQMRYDARLRIKRTVEGIAASAGTTAEVTYNAADSIPAVYNDPVLTARMVPAVRRVVGPEKLLEISPLPAADDFSLFQEKIPGFFLMLGVRKPGATLDEYPLNHSPRFKIDEASLKVGVRTLADLTVDYMLGTQ